MLIRRLNLKNHFYVLLAMLLLGLIAPGSSVEVRAQGLPLPRSGGDPTLTITGIETRSFPQVTVYLTGNYLGAAIDHLPLTLKEDNVAQELLSDQTGPVGLQAAMLLHLSVETRRNGVYGQAGQAVKQLATMGLFSPGTDWVAAYALDGSSPVAIQKWQPDLAAAAEALAGYTTAGTVDVPLYDQLASVLDEFTVEGVPTYLQKTVVLFSDGSDNGSTLGVELVAGRAREKGIRIYTVLLAPGAPKGESNLQLLARLTDGQFATLTTAADLDRLWPMLASGRTQRVLSYRTRLPQPHRITLEVKLPSGTVKSVDREFPPITLKPPQLQLYQGTDNIRLPISRTLILTRTASAYNSPLADLVPQQLELYLDLQWTDGYTRNLGSLAYKIDNIDQPALSLTPPGNLLALPAGTWDQGSRTLSFDLKDELKLPVPMDPLQVEVRTRYPTLFWWALVAGGVGLVVIAIGAIAGHYYLRPLLRRKREPASQPPGLPTDLPLAGLKLRVLQGVGLQQEFRLYQGQNRLGRDPQRANIVIHDHGNTVSGLHCIIAPIASGATMFRVTDQNSTHGTILNGTKVGPGGEILQPGNELVLGDVVLRVEVVTINHKAKGGEDITADHLKKAATP